MSPLESSVEDLCQQARICMKNRDPEGAIVLYEQAVSADPRSIPAHEGLATACFVLQDYDRAAELFQRVFRLDPRRPDPLVNLGAVYNRKGEYWEAVKVLRQALAKNRKCAEAYYNLGIAQKGLRQFKMAVSAYREVIRLAPEMAEAHYNLGKVLLEMGNFKQARLSFERALHITPGFAKAQQGLKKAQQLEEGARKAINPFGRLVDMDEVERKRTESAGQSFRHLSAQERFEDRKQVHRIAKESELTATGLLKQMRDELSPALLALIREVNEEEETLHWAGQAETFEAALERYQSLLSQLATKLHELQAHEQSIRN